VIWPGQEININRWLYLAGCNRLLRIKVNRQILRRPQDDSPPVFVIPRPPRDLVFNSINQKSFTLLWPPECPAINTRSLGGLGMTLTGGVFYKHRMTASYKSLSSWGLRGALYLLYYTKIIFIKNCRSTFNVEYKVPRGPREDTDGGTASV